MEEKAKNEDPKVLLTQGEDGKMKAIAGESKIGRASCRERVCQYV